MTINSQRVVQAGKGLRKSFLRNAARSRVVHEIRGGSLESGNHAASQVSLLQSWTEGTRKLLRPVSLSVSLLVCVLMSKATEEVTGGLGQLENRRSGSRPREFNWFVCAHPAPFTDKQIVVFLWQQCYGNS